MYNYPVGASRSTGRYTAAGVGVFTEETKKMGGQDPGGRGGCPHRKCTAVSETNLVAVRGSCFGEEGVKSLG
jgi:hypothetical protein